MKDSKQRNQRKKYDRDTEVRDRGEVRGDR